ncbi:MAG: phosphoribosylanthranilate isomerase [Clostridiales bacterium]|nr:phosphoribosylanthranilate isomerase [Clostridiales bacterium]
MSTKIKICGLRRVEDVDFVNEAKPDYAGVILCRRFWRGIDFDQAKLLRKRLDPNIPLVGVFVNDRFSDVVVALRQGVVDMVQLHGTESEEYITSVQMMARKPVIKACQVHDPSVIPYAVNSAADHILLDSGAGSGETFDWSIIQNVERPFILAGGLTPENIPQAIEAVHPWGIDISSGVETDKVKDRDKILAAVEAVRRFG